MFPLTLLCNMDVASEKGETDPDRKEFLRQDAFQRVQALLKRLEYRQDGRASLFHIGFINSRVII